MKSLVVCQRFDWHKGHLAGTDCFELLQWHIGRVQGPPFNFVASSKSMILSNLCLCVYTWELVYCIYPKMERFCFVNGELILQTQPSFCWLVSLHVQMIFIQLMFEKSWFWFCSPTLSYQPTNPNRLNETIPVFRAFTPWCSPRLVVYQQNLAPMCDALRDIGVQCRWDKTTGKSGIWIHPAAIWHLLAIVWCMYKYVFLEYLS